MLAVPNIEIYTANNVLSVNEAAKRIKSFRAEGKTVGLCHGGFDLLHPGHVKHFESAKKQCDVLCVSITTDQYVTSRKGNGRPIFTDILRAYMIAHLKVVDYVVISPWKTGIEIINKLKPSYYVKGPDFIGKQTPGTLAEKTAIKAVGGQIIYTTDPPSSTTAVIEYIQKAVDMRQFLIVIDRDGTLIENDDFFGKEANWQKSLIFNKPVVDFLAYLKTKYHCTMIVVTNQQGVARGYFPENRISEINQVVTSHLKTQGITIKSWQFCPDVDRVYAKKHPEINWVKKYVKSKTRRKPGITMITKTLLDLEKNLSDFAGIITLGDSNDDQLLAKNLKSHFLDIRTYKSLNDLIISSEQFFTKTKKLF